MVTDRVVNEGLVNYFVTSSSSNVGKSDLYVVSVINGDCDEIEFLC
jgi:hypothetical protein